MLTGNNGRKDNLVSPQTINHLVIYQEEFSIIRIPWQLAMPMLLGASLEGEKLDKPKPSGSLAWGQGWQPALPG